jgi:hypothetical protein
MAIPATLRKIQLTAALVGALMAAPSLAADDQDEQIKKDLFAVISLEGLPCGKVLRYRRQAESDYIAHCESTDHYRVRISAQNRVVVERQSE